MGCGTDSGQNEGLPVAGPELVAQVEFAEWTPDNHLRHEKFVGIREDKNAREVVRELAT
jgi:bifunctional non-homologous end joining protein LigD